jgi:hypothetical protein
MLSPLLNGSGKNATGFMIISEFSVGAILHDEPSKFHSGSSSTDVTFYESVLALALRSRPPSIQMYSAMIFPF